MAKTLAIALAQLNPTVGGVEGNVNRLLRARAEAAAQGAELMVSTELVISGYPPEDLVLKPTFVAAAMAAVERLAAATADGGPGLVVGSPWREGDRVMNAALLLDQGRIASVRFKHDLPNYGVFDEKRLFGSGPLPGPMPFRGVRLGVMVCEDMWTEDAAECLQESGAELLLVPNGSPFEYNKHDHRIQLAVARVIETGLPLAYVNQVGGQDELVFDGGSFAINSDRSLAIQLPSFRESVMLTRWRRTGESWQCEPGMLEEPAEGLEAIYQAMMLGLRDYVGKNGFPGVLIGLSGGIDSALTAVVAADALGAERVHALMMPSPFTSRESLEDAGEVARLLGIRLDTVSIEPAMGAFESMLKRLFGNRPRDVTEENVQARARGLTLMALSNKYCHMVLSTGNKSEMSVGYSTLYGDMCGGYSVLKDVYKTTIFELARWRNVNHPAEALGPAGRVIPERVIIKPPSAELRPNQTDQDTLPPYPVLDAILDGIIEHDLGVDDIVAQGYDRDTVLRVWRMVDLAEYKRRQAPPGVKITSRAFGRDRRYPITNAFRVR